MNRIFLAILVLALAAGGTFAQTGPAPGVVAVAPTDRNLLYVGRWDRTDPANSHGNWIGSYLRVGFTGTSAAISLGGHAGLDVSVDGEPARVVAGGPGVVSLTPAPLAPGRHALLVGVKGGGGWDFRGLVLDAGAGTLPPIDRPTIEFVGDSITCGSPGPLEAAGNYTWQTAEALGCDHTQISWPGRALTTGYGCQDDKSGLDAQYFQRNCFYDSPKAPWNFATYTPQIVVINLGQNDACGNEPDDTFIASYVRFVKNVRAKFPKAKIVALRMFGGGHFGEDTRKAVATINAGGDARVHFLDTAGWLDPADFADGVHPNASGNLKAAMRLAPLLKPLLPAKAQAAASPATVGDPANPNGLGQAVQNAYIRGDRPIVITPGTYLLSRKDAAQITLSHWHDAVVSAYKVTMILNNAVTTQRLFLLDHCVNTTIAGPLLSQTSQPAYQGRVIAIGKDAAGNPTCDLRLSAGYPALPADAKEFWFEVVDAKTRTLNIAAGDIKGVGPTALGNGSFRVSIDNRPVTFHAGDFVVSRYGDPPNKIWLSSCRNCTLKDISLMRNGFAPIFDGEGDGNHVLSCHWRLGPRPAGATEDPVVTNAADGIHSPDARVGPDIENCTFDGVFLDDCIAIHGGFHGIKSVTGSVVVADSAYAFYQVGEPVRISNDKGFYLQANVSALKDNGDGTSTLTLDTTETVPLDAKLSNPLADGAGYKIIGCRLGNTRSRGIIVKSDRGIIRGNVISRCNLGLLIGPGWPYEADYAQNLLVEGNTFVSNGGGIVVDGAGVKQNKNITLRNNRFSANTGSDVSVAWADSVLVLGNTFAVPPMPIGAKPRPPITVRDSSNVTVSGNLVKTPDAYAQPFVHVGANVTQLTQDTAP